MSIKSLIQIFLILLILFIIGVVYFEYFKINKKNIQKVDLTAVETQEQINELKKKISDLEGKNKELIIKIEDKKKNLNSETPQNIKSVNNKNTTLNKIKKNENNNIVKNEIIETSSENNIETKITKNLVKDIEYTSVDQKGNKFLLLATSGKSNINNNNILDLRNVRGRITSDIRDTIYIVSDFGQYNSTNLNSKFYQNVIIDYQDKKITCVNFDINMETNMAIAYNNVVITDPKSIMKAGIVEFDLKTKNINIEPKSKSEKIEVITD